MCVHVHACVCVCAYFIIYCVFHSTEATSDAALNIDAAANQEATEKPSQRRFQLVECGVRNVVFICCQEASVRPNDLVHYMLSNIKTADTKHKY